MSYLHLIKSLLTRGVAGVDLAFLLLGILNMLWIVVVVLLLLLLNKKKKKLMF
jgi:hypothetical protein